VFVLLFRNEIVRSLLSLPDINLAGGADAPAIVARTGHWVVALGLAAFAFVARHGCSIPPRGGLAGLG
jgi:hypothetical protein